ncbi:MAG: response regulator [Phycisphaerae bacterium]|nr:response regulator [Phycisphaerae bacterium]
MSWTTAAVCGVCVGLLVYGAGMGLGALREENGHQAQHARTLELADDVEDVVFSRFKDVVQALAGCREIVRAASGSVEADSPDTLIALETARRTFGASLVYVMDRQGTVVACTPFEGGETLTSQNYAFRPYFTEAMSGRDCVYPALGVTTHRRGLYFSSPVTAPPSSGPVGVVVAKAGFDLVDALLESQSHPAALVSPDGIVLSSNVEGWLYGCMRPLSAERREELLRSRQFGSQKLLPVGPTLDGETAEWDGVAYRTAWSPVLVAGWRILTLARADATSPLTTSQRRVLLYACGFLGVCLFFILLLVANVVKRRRAELALRQAHDHLEARVDERTRELAKANTDLKSEVAERKRIETMLRGSEERLSDIISFLPDATFVIDCQGRVTAWNRAMEGMTGVKSQDMLGKANHEYALPFYGDRRPMLIDHVLEPRDVVAENYSFIESQGDVLTIEARIRGGSDEPRVVWATAKRLVDADGNVVGAIESVRDITDRKRAEEESRRHTEVLRSKNLQLEAQRQEMKAQQLELVEVNRALKEAKASAEDASRAKSEFLANMSHEIRTPMTAILGFADILREEVICCDRCSEHVACRPRARGAQAVETIQRNGEYLMRILNDILDLSKIEAGRFEVRREACSPVAIVREVESLMRVRAEGLGLSFGIEFEGAQPGRVLTDATRLRQILINLVGNAIKFTSKGGVVLTVRYVGADACGGRTSGKGEMSFEVKDSGIGMSRDQVSGLFQPFQQADTSMTREHGGTGLGLAISKRLADLLGGDIVVDSALGEGSTFTLTISADIPKGGTRWLTREECLRTEGENGGSSGEGHPLGCRLLLAEDGFDNQRLLSMMLSKAGADVTLVENGKEALDRALAAARTSEPFDVILMDMQMPVMDGYEATRALRERGYTGPVIALTAHAMSFDRRRCLEAGCDDYASKPIGRRELVEKISKHLPRRPGEARGGSAGPALLFSDLSNDPDMVELLESFVAGLPGKAADLEALVSRGDVSALAELAHQLKGAGGGYGFPSITEAAREVEATARGLDTTSPAEDDLRRLRGDVASLVDLCIRASEARQGNPEF